MRSFKMCSQGLTFGVSYFRGAQEVAGSGVNKGKMCFFEFLRSEREGEGKSLSFSVRGPWRDLTKIGWKGGWLITRARTGPSSNCTPS